ncbi:hypothetical protein K503DRAFT_802793 [Rhizopogon vinicolor AM-OR11-026]|uniref:Uncharacterized protein n=1 Tax=Rhizopogon vinicolor AM-OR11-026 TaxID=1314800 RepID=A0A1B7MSA1_9AGAM|nr:hypothetical protein K503DRAFT_802793 [Rhizopogon vinicolor AM-OR11-026]
MSSPKLLSLANPYPLAPVHTLSAAAIQSARARPAEPDQSLTITTEWTSHTDLGMPSIEELLSHLANIWVPRIILFVLPPCIIIGFIITFPKHTFAALGISMLGLWSFTNYTVRVPLLRGNTGVSSIMAVHGHYFCYCLLYGIVIYGVDDSWIDYAAKALGLLAVLPLAVLFLWSVDVRRWDHVHPYSDVVLCVMFPVLPLLTSYSLSNSDSPSEKV